MSQSEVFTVREVAEQLRVSTETVRRWVREGTLDAIRIGATIRIPADQLERLRGGEKE